jgi:hypothetical protein
VTGRHVELVETLLRQRSDGLRRTRFGTHAGVGLQDPLEVAPEPLPPVEEPPVTGTCSSCGGGIPAARLKALPDATRCVSCQLQFEQQRA